MVDEVNAFSGAVLIPICDGDCTTTGGSHATYHVIRVVAFYLDYMSDQNSGQNLACEGNGSTLVPIAGNGAAAACRLVRPLRLEGRRQRRPIQGAGAIGIQLVK